MRGSGISRGTSRRWRLALCTHYSAIQTSRLPYKAGECMLYFSVNEGLYISKPFRLALNHLKGDNMGA